MTDLCRMTVAEARDLLKSGETTPAELALAVQQAIEQRANQLNCYRWVAASAVTGEMTGSTRSDPAPLQGIGGAVKANICSRDEPTDCGSRMLNNYRSPFDATAVARLKAAGSYVVGKTNMDEFGMGSSSEHSSYGVVRNPWNGRYTPGGSSGGSAAAVAADLAFYALGSDTGGSIRQPAHCCGVVGFKPTYGRISRHGLVAFASSLDQIGTLTKDVTDAALLYSVLAGFDPRDATSLRQAVGDPMAALDQPVNGLRIGVPRAALTNRLEPDVENDLEAAVATLTTRGNRILTIDLPGMSHAVAAYYVICCAEAASNLARYDGSLYGARQDADRFADMCTRTRSDGFGAEVKRRILLGNYVLAEGYHARYIDQAQRVRQLLREEFRQAFRTCDVIALPTAPSAAFELGCQVDDPLQMYQNDVFTIPASLAGLPAITVPTSVNDLGLPLSLQLIGPALQEERVLRVARAVEDRSGFRSRKEALWRR